jgi:hypothetical protein
MLRLHAAWLSRSSSQRMRNFAEILTQNNAKRAGTGSSRRNTGETLRT